MYVMIIKNVFSGDYHCPLSQTCICETLASVFEPPNFMFVSILKPTVSAFIEYIKLGYFFSSHTLVETNSDVVSLINREHSSETCIPKHLITHSAIQVSVAEI